MARLPRIVVPNLPLHIIHRGNNRQDVFLSEEDLFRIKDDISQSLLKSGCQLHAYVVMTNHLHFLLTPPSKHSLAVFMQSVANRYTRYFNAVNKRTGTLWEGRYKSCLVDSDEYLFRLYKYIEMNPVRAMMVESAQDYRWSSYQHNALGIFDPIISEHALYVELGEDTESRTANYRAIFANANSTNSEQAITNATIRGEVLGSDIFHAHIAKLVSRVTKLGAHGGDRKSEVYKKVKPSKVGHYQAG